MRETTSSNVLELVEDTQKDKFLTFRIENENYAIEISYVTEIIRILPITQVPHMPEFVKGIINLRGKIIPVIDVRLRFKKPDIKYDDRTCIIVVDVKEVTIGLIVDNVSEVYTIAETQIVEPPEFSSTKNKYIKGIGKIENEVKLILDCFKLIDQD